MTAKSAPAPLPAQPSARLSRRGALGAAAAAAMAPAIAEAQSPSQMPSQSPSAPAPAEGSLLEPGISRALAVHRAAELSDVHYDLSLDLTGRDLARGAVAIGLRRRPDAGDLILDFRGPALTEVRANGTAVTDYLWRDGHVVIPARRLKPGANLIEARFTTPIAPSGASIIRFDDKSDGATYLYTLLVPSDANLLFPCFDQPDLKARLTWRLRAPAAWSVLANARPTSRQPDGDAVRWTFAETEPIPTYLAAFAAGPWATWPSAPQGPPQGAPQGAPQGTPQGERPVTLYARASRKAEVDAETIIRANRDAARFLEGWFGVPFPFSKLDAVLAPAFPFGGMEHVGEIFYNENSFVFREPPTLPQRLGRDSTVYHEVSHQWFGDLVTMTWFDDLWLKEGFATYMAARVQAELKPESEAWKTFYLRNKPVAYAADATSGTNSVWQPLENLDGAKSNYGPIVYNKAPSIIKQLAFLVGDEAFRKGLHRFLTQHAYANATWRDLLSAIETCSGSSLKAFGDQYILRAGMPRVDTRLETEAGKVRRLELTQRPVRALPGDPGGFWPIKVQVRLGYTGRPDVVLPVRFEGETAVVEPAAGLPVPDYVWANDGDYGYGLFLPDARSAEWIVAHVGSVKDGLLRALLWGALWDLVRETRPEHFPVHPNREMLQPALPERVLAGEPGTALAPARFVELVLSALPGESDEQIASVLVGRASTVLVRYISTADAERLFPEWEALLAARAQDSGLAYGFRKAALDALVATARTSMGRKRLRDWLSGAVLFDGQPVRQLTRWNIVQRLLALGEPDAEAIFQAETQRDKTPEAGRSAFIARAATPSPAVKQDYFRRYLDDPSLNEEWVSSSLSAFNDPEQAALTYPFLRLALERLPWIREHRRIFFLPAWVNAFVRNQQSEAALAVVDADLKAAPELPVDIRRKVLEARDELELTLTVRRAAGAAI